MFGGTAMRRLLTALAALLAISVSARAQIQAPAQAQAPTQTHVVTNPRWLKIPSADDLSHFAPATARGRGGLARIRCVVTSRGTLDKCVVESETPEGLGFGNAALLLAPLFKMQPKMVDGAPVGDAIVVIPIRFGAGDAPPQNAQVKVANGLAWSAAPTAADVAAAFPADAVGRSISGHVVLRCELSGDGGLRYCDTMTEQPSGMGFARAARDLSKRFKIFNDPEYAKRMREVSVDVPFEFRDPRQPGPPLELLDPFWLQTADAASVGRLFPVEAAKAGLKTGRAILACQAAHDGSMSCTVAQEDPPGLGFGQAALAVAAVMKMNPWTPQGAPVDGANIRLPIRVNLTEPAAAANATAGK
jgi:TonB family protein